MNGKKPIPVNYSIKNIIDCILADSRAARCLSQKRKETLYAATLQTLNQQPALTKLLSVSHLHAYPIQGAKYFTRIGVLPPGLIIVDERFRNMCALPYWTLYRDNKGAAYRRFDRCPGYGWLPGCPPHSPSVENVKKVLDISTHFIVLQTRLLQERWETGWKFSVLHRLAKEIEAVCGQDTVTGTFGSGPCGACKAQHCLYHEGCKNPELKTASLESMGICVDRICSDLALLTGNRAWKLKWLRHFGLPQQKPRQWKYVEAISLKLPREELHTISSK